MFVGAGSREAGVKTMRPQSIGEEIANAISHGVGLVVATACLPFVIVSAAHRGGLIAAVGAGVFTVTVVLLYLFSTMYHAMQGPRTKRVFRVFDHCAIFMLIAGTYTPFTLGPLRGAWGWTLLTAVWTIAIGGVVAKLVLGIRYPWLSTALYVSMGWLVLLAIGPLWIRLPPAGWTWLAAGGLAYTSGVAFFATDYLPFRHFVWHLFVLAGTVCHAVAVWRYAA
jgi:hemolysin III